MKLLATGSWLFIMRLLAVGYWFLVFGYWWLVYSGWVQGQTKN